MEATQTQIERMDRLERFARTTKALALVSFVALACPFVVEKYLSASTSNEKILHVRGIAIEDSNGVPRLLLGAPVSNQGRKRRDAVTGLLLLGEDGTDRLTIGTADYDQINGTLQHRIAKRIGVLLNDANGNERGGFGFLENGRVTLVGLDRAHGEEGAFLTVNDEDGFAGVIVKDLTLRHTFGTLIKSQGADVAATKELMRHASVSPTMDRYVQAVGEQKKQAQHSVVDLLAPMAPRH